MGTLLELERLSKHFPLDAHRTVKAVDAVTMNVNRGDIFGIAGESGSGKTTLGRVILKLLDASSGTISYDGQDITGLDLGHEKRLRRKLQIVFQDPYASLHPRKKIKDIVGQGLRTHGLVANEQEMIERVGDFLSLVGMNEQHLYRYPHELSGGQRQRVAIARALILDPELVVLDEPTSSLDVSVQAEVLKLLKRLRDELDLTYLFITHDLSVVRLFTEKLAILYLGRIMEIGRTEAIFRHPLHPYTEALMSVTPKLDPDKRGGKIILQGEIPSPIDPPKGCPFHTRCFKKIGSICETERPELKDLGDGHCVACHLH
ncbi:MAG: ATP-binding cassette domain-containing protein [Synergistales bacterium]|nr:ATP-binding cassette domain-containing protein [Synergistales bacterium]